MASPSIEEDPPSDRSSTATFILKSTLLNVCFGEGFTLAVTSTDIKECSEIRVGRAACHHIRDEVQRLQAVTREVDQRAGHEDLVRLKRVAHAESELFLFYNNLVLTIVEIKEFIRYR